jgi:integrase
MRFSMGVIKNEHGVYIVRLKVPKGLEGPVAQVLGNGKSRQEFLQQSLRTKDKDDAKRRAPAVLTSFNRVLDRARALQSAPQRAKLSDAEIARIADVHYHAVLADDEDVRREGTGSEPLFQSVAQQLSQEGIEHNSPFAIGPAPRAAGLSQREEHKLNETVAIVLPHRQRALARGDISVVHDEVEGLLFSLNINLDRSSQDYRKLGMAVLKADVRALQAVAKRSVGEWTDTPAEPTVSLDGPASGEGLKAAFEGWKRHTEPSRRTTDEFERAIRLFTELHGDISIASITPMHARQFREALQAVPRRRTGALQNMTLPELARWGQEHASAVKITNATVNKLFSGVQSITKWGKRNGYVSADARMDDPFAGGRLPKQKSKREPFKSHDLQRLFNAPIYTEGVRPKGGHGEASYWLPLLALFTGARLSELAGLAVSDVRTDDDSGVTALFIVEDRERGRSIKTASSERAVPVHPELVRLGFLDYVMRSRKAGGDNAWLFPLVAPGTDGERAWSKWFGRYRRRLGVTSADTVFHSFRHAFKDALRRARVGEERSDALTGHTSASIGRSYGAKGMLERFGWKELAEDVAGVRYPGLDLSHIRRQAGTRPERKR